MALCHPILYFDIPAKLSDLVVPSMGTNCNNSIVPAYQPNTNIISRNMEGTLLTKRDVNRALRARLFLHLFVPKRFLEFLSLDHNY